MDDSWLFSSFAAKETVYLSKAFAFNAFPYHQPPFVCFGISIFTFQVSGWNGKEAVVVVMNHSHSMPPDTLLY